MAGINKDGGAGIGPHEIYVKITTGPGTGTLEAAKNATLLEAQAEAERTTLVSDLTKMIGNGWEGSASEAAYDVTKPLVDIGQQRTEHVGNAYGHLQDQLAAFADVKNKVRPVSATPPPASILVEAEPWLADLDHTTKAYQNDSQNNIAAFGAYDSSSKANGEGLPREYPALKDPGNSPEITLADDNQQSGDTSSSSGSEAGRSHTGSGVPSVPSGSSGTATSRRSAPHPGGQPVTQGPQVPGTTAPSSVNPPVYQPGTGGYPQAPAAQGPTYGSPTDPYSPYGGSGYGPNSGRYGGNSSGYGGGSAGGSGSGARTGGSPESGARSGAGAMPVEEAMARRAGGMGPAGAGRAGMGGMGAGHGGSKEEDTEHERPSFLQEDDPEDIFGTDEVTAPPVIE